MRQIRFNPINRQVSGLSGRRTRSPLVKKYSEASLRPRREIAQPTLAPQRPPFVKRVPFDGGPGIGPGEGAVGGIEAGSTFGNNPDPVAAAAEQAVMANTNASALLGLPAFRGAKSGLTAVLSGANLSQSIQAAALPAITTGLLMGLTKGPVIGINAAKAARGLAEKGSDLNTNEAINAINMSSDLVANPTTAVTPANQALTSSPTLASMVAEINAYKSSPKSIIGAAIKGLKNLAAPGAAPQIAVDPSQTGGFDFGGHPMGGAPNPEPSNTGGFDFGGRAFGSGSSPGLDAAAQAAIASDPSLGMGQGGALAGNVGSGGVVGASTGRGDGMGDVGGGDGDGGTALCTSLYRQNLMSQELYVADVNYAGTLDQDILSGYYVWAKHVAKAMDNSKVLTFILKWPILQWAENMAFYGSSAKVGKPTWFGKFAEYVGFPICKFISNNIRN